MWFSTHSWMLVSTKSPELFSQVMIPAAFSNAVEGLPATSAREAW